MVLALDTNYQPNQISHIEIADTIVENPFDPK